MSRFSLSLDSVSNLVPKTVTAERTPSLLALSQCHRNTGEASSNMRRTGPDHVEIRFLLTLRAYGSFIHTLECPLVRTSVTISVVRST
ncbi:Rho Guanine Nucleotide Exchange Factor 11 [Manis pentadactyla]|nr:Rho Guanine Nucleotide Exchange Factor 11 [Manis pentadactyla]